LFLSSSNSGELTKFIKKLTKKGTVKNNQAETILLNVNKKNLFLKGFIKNHIHLKTDFDLYGNSFLLYIDTSSIVNFYILLILNNSFFHKNHLKKNSFFIKSFFGYTNNNQPQIG